MNYYIFLLFTISLFNICIYCQHFYIQVFTSDSLQNLISINSEYSNLVWIGITVLLCLILGIIFIKLIKLQAEKKKNTEEYNDILLINNDLKHDLQTKNFEIESLNEELQNHSQYLERINSEITEQKDFIHDSYSKIRELAQLNELITNLFAHDFKISLHTILHIPSSIGLQTQMQIAKQSARQMQNIMHNYLDIRKQELSQIQLVIKQNSISDMVNLAINQVSLLYLQKEISIKCEIENNIVANFDYELIERVLNNLLIIAIRNSEPKSILEIKYINNCDTDCYTMSISFFGQATATVNEIFSQINNTELDALDSTTICLKFCKIAISTHQGTIGMENKTEKHKELWFTLPKCPDL